MRDQTRDQGLETALEQIGREQFTPSAELIRETKQRVAEGRLLPAAVFLSCMLQIATGIAVVVVLVSGKVSLATWVYGLLGLFGLTGLFCLLILMVHRDIRLCFVPLERMLECD